MKSFPEDIDTPKTGNNQSKQLEESKISKEYDNYSSISKRRPSKFRDLKLNMPDNYFPSS